MDGNPRMFWWKAVDWVPLLTRLGFSEQAINEAHLFGKRVEFRMSDMTLHVKADLQADASIREDGGLNYVHVCPPDCPE